MNEPNNQERSNPHAAGLHGGFDVAESEDSATKSAAASTDSETDQKQGDTNE